MANYLFEQFGTLEIEPTIIKVIRVIDTLESKTADVDVMLISESANYMVTLNGFTYADGWSDEEVKAWVLTKLNDYLI